VQEMPTERIHEEMNQVIAEGGAVATVARAVDALNLSLAHHAAWTEERFDKVDQRFDEVDDRLGSLEQGQLRLVRDLNQLNYKVDKGFARVDARMDRFEIRLDGLEAKIDGVEANAAMRHASLEAKFDRMSARVEEVLSFAIRDERRVDGLNE
jgi:hypothetical protein